MLASVLMPLAVSWTLRKSARAGRADPLKLTLAALETAETPAEAVFASTRALGTPDRQQWLPACSGARDAVDAEPHKAADRRHVIPSASP